MHRNNGLCQYYLTFPIKKDTAAQIEFKLPRGEYHEGRFKLQCDADANCMFDGRDIIIEQKPKEYNLRIDGVNLDECRWDFLVNGSSRRKKYNAVYLTNDEKEAKAGRLVIDDIEFDYKITAYRDIIPIAYLVYPESRQYPGQVIVNGHPCEIRSWRIFREKPVAAIGYTLTEQPTHGSDLKIFTVATATTRDDYTTTGGTYPYDQTGDVHDSAWRKDDGGNNGNGGDRRGNDGFTPSGGGRRRVTIGDNYPPQPPTPPHPHKNPKGFERKLRIGMLSFIALAVLIVAGYFVYNKWLRPAAADKVIAKCAIVVDSQLSDIPKLQLDEPTVTVDAPDIDGRPFVKMIENTDTMVILYQPKYFDDSEYKMDDYAKDVLETVVCLRWSDDCIEKHPLKDLDEGYMEQAMIRYTPEKATTKILTLPIKPKAISDAETFNQKYWSNDTTAQVFYAAAKKLAKERPVLKKFLIAKCWEKCDTTNLDGLTAYLEAFPNGDLLYDDDKYQQAEKKKTKLKDDAEKQQDFTKAVNLHGDALWAKDCTATTVRSARAWYNTLTGPQKKQAKYMSKEMGKMLEAYERIFFNAKEAGDLQPRFKHFFSPYQKIAYHYYGESPTNFETCKKNRANAQLFKIPYQLDPSLKQQLK